MDLVVATDVQRVAAAHDRSGGRRSGQAVSRELRRHLEACRLVPTHTQGKEGRTAAEFGGEREDGVPLREPLVLEGVLREGGAAFCGVVERAVLPEAVKEVSATKV